MAVDNFIYQGINRAVSDYSGARACEELINLRPTEGGLMPVKDFSALFSNVDWEKVLVHYTTSGPKYIVVKRGSSAVEVYYLINASDPTSLSSFFTVTGLDTDAKINDVLEHLYFAAAGNIVLFSICAPSAVKYENHAYTWKFDETANALKYVTTEAEVPSVTYSVSSTEESATDQIMSLTDDTDGAEVVSTIESALNSMQEDNPNLCLGPIIFAIAYKTTDGQTFWTEKWGVYDPIPSIEALNPGPYVDELTDLPEAYQDDYSDFFTKYGAAFNLRGTQDGTQMGSLKKITVYGSKVSITLKLTGAWNEDTSLIQSVELYCSKPAIYMDASKAGEGFTSEANVGAREYMLLLPQKKYEDMDLGGQLLYLQGSIPLPTLQAAGNSGIEVSLTFGGNIQMTEESLDADAGALKRYGRILSYNARFHYYDSVSKINVGMPSFVWSGSGTSATPSIFVRYSDDDQSGLLYLGTTSGKLGAADVVIAPSINIKEVVTATSDGLGYVYVTTYRMTASTSYNYSICVESASTSKITNVQFQASEYYALIQGGANSILDNVETDAINVSEQYNPFVFRVEHSYKAPGNIIDVQPQMAGIVDASYGRDPLNVFTERGLYALTQGSADVLYGAFLPLSNLKASRGGIPVESGTYFLADGNLWLVSGRKVILVSEALTPGPHKFIRECLGYKKLSGQDSTFSPTPAITSPFPVYDASPFLSQVTFEEFVRGNATAGKAPATLSYNRFRQELFVSSKSYNYTYVVSLKTGQWHKISRKVWQDDPGSPIINIPGSATSTISILDMSSEVSSSATPLLIHLQSRPFSLGYQYAHIHRIVAMMRAKLPSASYKVTTALYGSDDLQHWNILSYGKWAGKTEEDPTTHETTDTPLYLSQLRTPSAARSWRYYTVCIGGKIPVSTDFPTDIGPVLVDYKPVVRRLG